MKNSTYAPLVLLMVSLVLAAASIILKSLFIIAGVTGLVIAWFLCIDKLIVAPKLSTGAKIVFITAIIGVPFFMSMAMG